jgi:hypothetical protein
MKSKIYSHDPDVSHQIGNPRVISETCNGNSWSDLDTYINLSRATRQLTNNGTRIGIVIRNRGPSHFGYADIYKLGFDEFKPGRAWQPESEVRPHSAAAQSQSGGGPLVA